MSSGTDDRVCEKFGGEVSLLKERCNLESTGNQKSRGAMQWLVGALVLSIVIIIALIITIAMQSTIKETSQVSSTISKESIVSAAYITNSMDGSVDPCKDFYEYACGSWKRKNVIPDDRANQNVFGVLRDDLLVTLKGLLESSRANEANSIKEAKTLYASCMNESSIEMRGSIPLRTNVFDVFGEWPVVSQNWTSSGFDLVSMVAKLGLYNNKLMWSYWVSADDKNSSVNIIQFDQPDLGLPSREYFLNSKYLNYVEAYKLLMRSVALEYDSTLVPARVDEDVDAIVAFETQLANLTMPKEERRDSELLYHKMTLQQMHTNLTDKIDWTRFLNITFQSINVKVPQSEAVVVYAPDYLRRLGVLLETTSNRTIANYLLWRLVMNRIKNLPKRFRQKDTDFNRVFLGIESERARWKTCTNVANSNMGNAVGRLFVDEYFDESAKSNALEMIHDIRQSFKGLLDDVSWMDDQTKKAAHEKADAINEKVGYPDYIKNDTALGKEYEGLAFVRDDYFFNTMVFIKFTAGENLKLLRQPVDRNKWSSAPAVVNAFYSSFKNQIIFPAGILQPPFFGKDRLRALNYGAIGMIIGHEITHGFDDQGRQFDKNGNLVQWWSSEAVDAFKKEASCIVNQYGNYTVTQVGMKLNGIQTQGENIADNGGIKAAFMAYKQWTARHGEEQPLPGLDLSPDQLFFLGFAQIWCGIDKDSALINSINTGVHSPGQYRVIGSLSNSQEFIQAFKCSKNSQMNPLNNCKVW